MQIESTRVVAIRCEQQRGSGYLITPRLILTAAHVVSGSESSRRQSTNILAHAANRFGVVECEVVWKSAREDGAEDAALLIAKEDLVPEQLRSRFPLITFGEFRSLEPRTGCFVTGFPRVGRAVGRIPHPEQIWGTLAPGSGIENGKYILSSSAFPPEAAANERSPWGGLSGAAVFFRKFLVGIVVEDDDPRRWRHSRVLVLPISTLLADPSFCEIVSRSLGRSVNLTGISDEEVADQRFEERYAEAVHAEHGKIRIFGLDLSRSTGRGLDLDTAYLNLEAVSSDDEIEDLFAQTRVDELLKNKRRILLRGQAGSGKSTLIQWIATKAVTHSLDGPLSSLNGRVPFVLRLRAMFRLEKLRPKPSEFLYIGNIPIADDQPVGWADRALRDGRALLLVDGMDEIPEEHRHEAREWLGWLLEHYPHVWALVTVRPSAVPRGWLKEYGFRELVLSPMDRSDRQIFIEQWHKAALVEATSACGSDMERERITRELSELEKGLIRSLEVSPQLATLTDSPLLCAMICALHRDRNGALPSGRMEIYRAALGMLLARRDQERHVDLPLEEDEHRALLQETASWLVNEGLTEGGKSDAINQIFRILPSLHRINMSLTPEQVYDHIMDRSGLITETSTETFEFIHRTFQDYLAAQEFKEARSFSMLARHANDEQWEDVIRMTVGHCDHRDRAELLRKIVAAGDSVDDESLRRRIHLLAGSCLPYSSRLDRQVRDEVLARICRLLPVDTASSQDADKLAAVGDDIITVFSSIDVRPWVLQVLGRLRSDRAFDFLRRVASSLDERSLRSLGSIWESFDIERFSTEILSQVDCEKVRFWISDPVQLRELRKHGSLGMVTFDYINSSELVSALQDRPVKVSHLTLANSQDMSDVNFLQAVQGVKSLTFLGCFPLSDISAISKLSLESLSFVDSMRGHPKRSWQLGDVMDSQGALTELGVGVNELWSLEPNASFARITRLKIWYPQGVKDLRRAAQLFPNAETLEVRLMYQQKRQVIDISAFCDRPMFHLIAESNTRPIIRGKKLFSAGSLTLEIGTHSM
ncbi:NACHT domain-containing protein [Streptomyces jietaisiensis]|uniref:NACHT domain-containing protein n=1 Tax=Streptomyces griseoaurantiacus TaxID=68213 RepID=UPI002E2B9B5B|nr:NACHT domain-containing protein [Streptomyces jietaisiensis]